MADTKNVLGLVALGIGGVILYKKFTDPEWDISSLFDPSSWFDEEATQPAPAINQAGQPATIPAIMAPTAPPLNVTVMQSTVALAKKSMPIGWDGLLTADEWNYFYTIVSGVQQTMDLHTEGLRGERITAETYAGRRTAKGLSGIGTVRYRDIPGIIRSGGAGRYELAQKREIN